jgi:hypothetical protein
MLLTSEKKRPAGSDVKEKILWDPCQHACSVRLGLAFDRPEHAKGTIAALGQARHATTCSLQGISINRYRRKKQRGRHHLCSVVVRDGAVLMLLIYSFPRCNLRLWLDIFTTWSCTIFALWERCQAWPASSVRGGNGADNSSPALRRSEQPANWRPLKPIRAKNI